MTWGGKRAGAGRKTNKEETKLLRATVKKKTYDYLDENSKYNNVRIGKLIDLLYEKILKIN